MAWLEARDAGVIVKQPDDSDPKKSVSEEPLNKSIDVSFSVPFVHRVRVTDDVAGKDFDQLLGVLNGEVAPAKVLIVSETALHASAQRIGERMAGAESIQLVAEPLLVIGGEEVKNSTDATKQVLARINDSDLDRRSYIVAIGGGAMLDAVGYAAAVAHRGIRLVRLPATTLRRPIRVLGSKTRSTISTKRIGSARLRFPGR